MARGSFSTMAASQMIASTAQKIQVSKLTPTVNLINIDKCFPTHRK